MTKEEEESLVKEVSWTCSASVEWHRYNLLCVGFQYCPNGKEYSTNCFNLVLLSVVFFFGFFFCVRQVKEIFRSYFDTDAVDRINFEAEVVDGLRTCKCSKRKVLIQILLFTEPRSDHWIKQLHLFDWFRGHGTSATINN